MYFGEAQLIYWVYKSLQVPQLHPLANAAQIASSTGAQESKTFVKESATQFTQALTSDTDKSADKQSFRSLRAETQSKDPEDGPVALWEEGAKVGRLKTMGGKDVSALGVVAIGPLNDRSSEKVGAGETVGTKFPVKSCPYKTRDQEVS
jgi:hypothetical protein